MMVARPCPRPRSTCSLSAALDSLDSRCSPQLEARVRSSGDSIALAFPFRAQQGVGPGGGVRSQWRDWLAAVVDEPLVIAIIVHRVHDPLQVDLRLVFAGAERYGDSRQTIPKGPGVEGRPRPLVAA